MLHSTPASSNSSRQPSPRRRLVQPGLTDNARASPGAEFVGSTPASGQGRHGISSSAFSPNYFSTFFIEEKELGRGGKGVVLLVRHVLDGVHLGHFACKRIPVGDDHEWLEKVLVEVQLLQNLSHPNLVSYKHVWLEDFQVTKFGPSVPCAFILQQYCNGGDLHSYIVNSARTSITTQQLKDRIRRHSKGQPEPPADFHGPRQMSFEEIFSFFKDITTGLHHLHTNGYIHRDLKPQNCLLHRTGAKTRVLVSDFGEVQVVDSTRKSTGATGTISFCAPEVVRHTANGAFGNFTTKSDIFSLGMIVYFMCFGKLPYQNADELNEENEDVDRLRAEVSTWAGFDEDRRLRHDLPERLYKFLKRLLSLNPNERPTTEEILRSIRAGSALDDYDAFPTFNAFEDMGPRISRADTPSPAPERLSIRKKSFLRQPIGQTPLRHASVEVDRSPSPTSQPHEPDGSLSPSSSSVMLHPRDRDIMTSKDESDGALSPRLLLPAPPPSHRARIIDFVLHPLSEVIAKMLLFQLKLASIYRTCSPHSAHPSAVQSLLMLGLVDFASLVLPNRGPLLSATSSLGLTVLHFVGLYIIMRRNALCLPYIPSVHETFADHIPVA